MRPRASTATGLDMIRGALIPGNISKSTKSRNGDGILTERQNPQWYVFRKLYLIGTNFAVRWNFNRYVKYRCACILDEMYRPQRKPRGNLRHGARKYHFWRNGGQRRFSGGRQSIHFVRGSRSTTDMPYALFRLMRFCWRRMGDGPYSANRRWGDINRDTTGGQTSAPGDPNIEGARAVGGALVKGSSGKR